jgi:hypothetical protein
VRLVTSALMLTAILEDMGYESLKICLPVARKAPIKHGMSNNVFDIETHRTLEALIQELGGLDECKRLGFVFEDENRIMSLSVAGMGYLLFVKTVGVNSLAEAFAAGYQCRAEEITGG